MKIVLGTSNLMSSGQSVMRRPMHTKSNVELVNGLRATFALYRNHSATHKDTTNTADLYRAWTTQEDDTLYVPSFRPQPLAESRESYEITVKLFYLPGIPADRRCEQTKEAISLVLRELGVQNVDLLIVSYPGVSFDADDDGEEELSVDEDASASSDASEGLEAQLKTWKVLEHYHRDGTIARLGLSEFSSERLDKFLPEVTIKPTVDQINIKDCCVVPKSLIVYAKDHSIDLFTHNDCMDILPCGTTREILGPGENNAAILSSGPESPADEPGLKGNIEPQWVVKYTAVIKDRGVVENKGYFALAQLSETKNGQVKQGC